MLRMLLSMVLLLTSCSPDEDKPTDRDAPSDSGTPADDPTDDAGTPTDTGADQPPEPPAELVHWLTGSADDAQPTPTEPGAFLGGGGGDVGTAMAAWMPAGGDVVVLRTSGEDGYNDWLYAELGGVDSVETLRVDTPALADDPYVAWRVETAEAVFMAGGDQWTYLDRWSGTALHTALRSGWDRGVAVGGTSAGAAVLGSRAFSAEVDTIDSETALNDPYHPALTFADSFLSVPVLAGVVTDTHFYERDRFGRLVTFMARMIADGAAVPVVGVGVDEDTAVVVQADGTARVEGDGYAYVLTAHSAPTTCTPGAPLSLSGWTYRVVHPGDALVLPDGTGDGPVYPLDVEAGRLVPASPY